MSKYNEILFEPYAGGIGIEWLEGTFIPQSLLFYAQILPIVYRCALHVRCGKVLQVADIGAAHAAGSNFMQNTLNNLMAVSVEFTAFELQERFKKYATTKFPSVKFKTTDFFDDDINYDLVVCSHTLEHIPEPQEFVRNVVERIKSYAIFYVPYRERELIPDHVNSFDDQLIESMPGYVWGRQFKSLGWRTEDDSSVAAFVCASPSCAADFPSLRADIEKEFFGSQIGYASRPSLESSLIRRTKQVLSFLKVKA